MAKWAKGFEALVHPCDKEIVEHAEDLVALWESPKIQGLPREERNAAIDSTRQALIKAVHRKRTTRP